MRDSIDSTIRSIRSAHALSKLVGDSPSFIRALERIPLIARGDASVLIAGETGTGKELFARAIHYLGPRRAFPFVPVNCGTLPENLLEDELFGHEKGAFTDAKRRRSGLLAQADKGTLFLDEVDGLAPRAQVALLRVLQDRRFRVLGSEGESRTDIRILAATNSALDKLTSAGRFRPDLYYRLRVLSLEIPPLRERRDDIPRLAGHFLRENQLPDAALHSLSPEAERALLAHDWPGNVRELENAIIRGIHMSRGSVIGEEDLGLPPPPVGSGVPAAIGHASGGRSFRDAKRDAVAAFEHEYLECLMREHRGNVSSAARSAGKERRDLGRLLKKHGFDPRAFAPRAAADRPGEE